MANKYKNTGDRITSSHSNPLPAFGLPDRLIKRQARRGRFAHKPNPERGRAVLLQKIVRTTGSLTAETVWEYDNDQRSQRGVLRTSAIKNDRSEGVKRAVTFKSLDITLEVRLVCKGSIRLS